MSNLKRISDEGIIDTFQQAPIRGSLAYIKGVEKDKLNSHRLVAQAQLEADQKVHDAVVRELQDKLQTLRELMGGQKAAHKAVVREIFERIESKLGIVNDFGNVAYVGGYCSWDDWQALKQKYGGQVNER